MPASPHPTPPHAEMAKLDERLRKKGLTYLADWSYRRDGERWVISAAPAKDDVIGPAVRALKLTATFT